MTWFGGDEYRQAFLVSHLAPVVDRIKADAYAAGAAAAETRAVEMARKANQAERRAEEAEFHVEQLRDERDSAERLIDSRAGSGCIHGDCVLLPTRPPTYRCGECGATFNHRPEWVKVTESEQGAGDDTWQVAVYQERGCEHQWLDRPESDTRVCELCGEER